MDNTPYFLALNRINGIGPRAVMSLLTRWPDLSELFKLSTRQLMDAGLSQKMASAIASFNQQHVVADLKWRDAPHHFLLTWESQDYPALLKEIHDPPIVLYAIGDLSCLANPCLAMVGTRKPSASGRETAQRFAHDLSLHNITIVSGLALGIDAYAHTGCLEAHGKTIAVMGTGIDCIYPHRHVKLAERICQTGLLMSEFPLQTPPIAGHFPRRNRIISGLSLSTLVVEAAVRSGSLITARMALEQNRDVLAIPGSIHNLQARGCHHLLQQGARLVASIDDVLDELGFVKKVSVNLTKPRRPKSGNPLANAHSSDLSVETTSGVNNVSADLKDGSTAQRLMACLSFEPTTVDQLMEHSGISVEDVMCALAELECQGMVNAVPGGYVRYNE